MQRVRPRTLGSDADPRDSWFASCVRVSLSTGDPAASREHCQSVFRVRRQILFLPLLKHGLKHGLKQGLKQGLMDRWRSKLSKPNLSS